MSAPPALDPVVGKQQWGSHWGGQGGQSAIPDSEKFAKNREKSGKIGKKEGKSGRKGKNQEGSFTLPLLTDRAGYATGMQPVSALNHMNDTAGLWVSI